jgi:hypothetical protein
MFNAYAIIDDFMDKGWCLESAEAVLKLCSLRSSGDVETYWRFHITTGVSRNLRLTLCGVGAPVP